MAFNFRKYLHLKMALVKEKKKVEKRKEIVEFVKEGLESKEDCLKYMEQIVLSPCVKNYMLRRLEIMHKEDKYTKKDKLKLAVYYDRIGRWEENLE